MILGGYHETGGIVDYAFVQSERLLILVIAGNPQRSQMTYIVILVAEAECLNEVSMTLPLQNATVLSIA